MASQREAYEECVRMAGLNGWWAAYNALVEDGFDAKTDFVGMLEKWKGQEVRNGS